MFSVFKPKLGQSSSCDYHQLLHNSHRALKKYMKSNVLFQFCTAQTRFLRSKVQVIVHVSQNVFPLVYTSNYLSHIVLSTLSPE